MQSTMQDMPLLVSGILRHGQQVYGESRVITVEADHSRAATFTEVAARAERLAKALGKLGVGRGDVVGTFCWNHQKHLEAYLAVPSMGAVLHTVNVRLFPDQLAHVLNHAEDRVLIADAALLPLLASVWKELKTVESIVAIGEVDTQGFDTTFDYDELLAAEEAGYDWPLLDERDAAAMCYTTGTTGMPKGVVYSHRSTFLHSMSVTSAASIGMTERDRILVIVPMFHVNAWGTPYAAWMVGTDIVMPQTFLSGEALARIIPELRPTLACGVPTIWTGLLRAAEDPAIDLSSLRHVTAGGSAVPRSLIEAFNARVGIPLTQGWGMTETSPLAALAVPPADAGPDEELEYRAKAGRVVAGVELRIVAPDGQVLANDGASVGEIETRGPWVTGSYYKDPDPARFDNGWLRTGDVGTLDPRGYLTISDRTKDVIKSGGEWISSVELEGEVMAHPAVLEATVIGVPDPRWQERPLVALVPAPDAEVNLEELVSFLVPRVPRWWLPERWAIVREIPKTSVGKFDKKVLRAEYEAGKLHAVTVPRPARQS